MPGRKKRVGLSHRVAAGMVVMTVILFVFNLVYVAVTRDSSPLSWLNSGIFAMSAVVLTFYLEKSKKENVAKIDKNYIPQYEYMTDFEREMAIHKVTREEGEHE